MHTIINRGMKILIVKMSSLGDVVQTLPVLLSLKTHFPDAHITWLVEEQTAELLADHPLINRVIVFPKRKWLRELTNHRTWAHFFREIVGLVDELRSCPYDLVLDFQGLFKSGILVGISRGKRKIGFSPGKEKSDIFLNEKVAYPKTRLHAVERYLYLIETLGCLCKSPQFFIPIRQVHRDKVLKFLKEQRITPDTPLVLLHPGARWKTKLWEEEKWAALGDLLSQANGAQVIFTGSRDDFSLTKRIIERMKFPGINTAGRWSLKELAFLQKQANVVVIPDTGPMHLGVAIGTPVVALFGPTDPGLTGPYGDIHRIILKDVECRPCFKRKCSANKCMVGITVREVWEATESYVSHSSIPKVIAT